MLAILLGHMRGGEIYLGREAPVPGLALVASGKVRDVYALDEQRLLFVTTDRVSAFDVLMREGVPHKGRVLTAISAWWFERTRDLIENHLLSTRVEEVPGLDDEWRARLRGRVMLVARASPTPVEWVVRGYLAGSGWKEYQAKSSVCGVPLHKGLRLASRLPEPILTPTTKEEQHDLPLSPREARAKVGAAVFERAERAALALYKRGAQELKQRGILLADTKFEFGVLDGRVLLIDEALTPDSSRFWDAAQWREDESPASYDKQILRDWLEAQPWNKEAPPPALAPAIVERLSERYLEICRKITGEGPRGIEA